MQRRGTRQDAYRGRRQTTYHLEVARDEIFNDVVQHVATWQTQARTDILAPGDYFWRIASLDKDGLKGAWSPTGQFSVQRNLQIAFGPDRVLVQHGGRAMSGPGVTFRARAKTRDTTVSGAQYSVNGAPFGPAPGGVVLSKEGDYSIMARGVGLDGHDGPVEEATLFVDATLPRITIHYGYPEVTDDGTLTVMVTIKAEDNIAVSCIDVSIDGGPFRKYDAPFPLDARTPHTLSARAVDVVGNHSLTRTMQIAAIQE
jgi:hypothetical protein